MEMKQPENPKHEIRNKIMKRTQTSDIRNQNKNSFFCVLSSIFYILSFWYSDFGFKSFIFRQVYLSFLPFIDIILLRLGMIAQRREATWVPQWQHTELGSVLNGAAHVELLRR